MAKMKSGFVFLEESSIDADSGTAVAEASSVATVSLGEATSVSEPSPAVEPVEARVPHVGDVVIVGGEEMKVRGVRLQKGVVTGILVDEVEEVECREEVYPQPKGWARERCRGYWAAISEQDGFPLSPQTTIPTLPPKPAPKPVAKREYDEFEDRSYRPSLEEQARAGYAERLFAEQRAEDAARVAKVPVVGGQVYFWEYVTILQGSVPVTRLEPVRATITRVYQPGQAPVLDLRYKLSVGSKFVPNGEWSWPF